MARVKTPLTWGPPVRVVSKWTGMPIPRMEAEEQCLFLEKELLQRTESDSENTWVIDLSEYVDGVTLAHAGGLAGFREMARLKGCEVQYTGL